MTTTNVSKTNQIKSTTKPNDNGSGDHSDQPDAASTTPVTPTSVAPEKKPVTVMIPEALHRKVKVLAELSGTSLSDLVETEMKALVKSKLPGLLAGLDAEG